MSEQELRSNPALSKHFLCDREDGEDREEKDDLIRVEFTVGCGTTGVDRRLEAALTTFLERERSRLTLRLTSLVRKGDARIDQAQSDPQGVHRAQLQ